MDFNKTEKIIMKTWISSEKKRQIRQLEDRIEGRISEEEVANTQAYLIIENLNDLFKKYPLLEKIILVDGYYVLRNHGLMKRNTCINLFEHHNASNIINNLNISGVDFTFYNENE